MNHGHVKPNADGSRARCGGPGICAQCSLEAQQAKMEEKMLGNKPENTGVGEFCHPGPADTQSKKWMLVFDDRDRGTCIFENEDEARTAFADAEGRGYNCHLFASETRAKRNAEPVANLQSVEELERLEYEAAGASLDAYWDKVQASMGDDF